MTDYYAALVGALGGRELVIGGKRQHIPAYCPYCGKDNSKEIHSSYGEIFPGREPGFKCFTCGTARSLKSVYNLLTGNDCDDNDSHIIATLQPSPERTKPYWKADAARYLRSFTNHNGRYDAWLAYKGLTPEIVDKYSLGLGVLPQSRYKDERLIVPIIQGGEVVMFRGRRITGDGAKWAASGGVSPAEIELPLWEYATKDILFIVENPVDAILVNEYSRACAVCSLSTNYWYPHWTHKLKELNPSLIVTAYDADIAGEGVPMPVVIDTAKRRVKKIYKARQIDLDRILIKRVNASHKGWRIDWQSDEHEGTLSIPAPAGVQRRNALTKAGLPVQAMPWGAGDIEQGMDIGKLFTAQLV